MQRTCGFLPRNLKRIGFSTGVFWFASLGLPHPRPLKYFFLLVVTSDKWDQGKSRKQSKIGMTSFCLMAFSIHSFFFEVISFHVKIQGHETVVHRLCHAITITIFSVKECRCKSAYIAAMKLNTGVGKWFSNNHDCCSVQHIDDFGPRIPKLGQELTTMATFATLYALATLLHLFLVLGS